MLSTRAAPLVARYLLSSSLADAFPEVRSVLIVASSLPRSFGAQPAAEYDHTHRLYDHSHDPFQSGSHAAAALLQRQASAPEHHLLHHHAPPSPNIFPPDSSSILSTSGPPHAPAAAQPGLPAELAAMQHLDAAPAAEEDYFHVLNSFNNEVSTASDLFEGRSLPVDPELALQQHYQHIHDVRARSRTKVDPDKLGQLYIKQAHLEMQSEIRAREMFQKEFESNLKRADAPVLGSQNLTSSWRQTLLEAIKAEQEAVVKGEPDKETGVKNKTKTNSRALYGPFLIMLPAEEVADILIHASLSATLLARRGHGTPDSQNPMSDGIPVTLVARTIGRRLNDAVSLKQLARKVQQYKQHIKAGHREPFMASQAAIDWSDFTAQEAAKIAQAEKLLQRISKDSVSKYFTRQRYRIKGAAKVLLEGGHWSTKDHVVLGARLLDILLQHAKVYNPRTRKEEPAFAHSKAVLNKREPLKSSGVLHLSDTASRALTSVRESLALMQPEYNPMVVEPRPWRGPFDGGYLTLRAPMMRTRHSARLAARVAQAASDGRLQFVYDALNALGNTPWVINREVFEVMSQVWKDGGGLAGVPQAKEYIRPPPLRAHPGFRLVADGGQLVATGLPPLKSEKQRHRWDSAMVQRRNRELASLRATFQHRLRIAEQFVGEEAIYYPHNIDFRGRAYPIHPHLNHLGDDLCRGLLKFAEARPLGREGLDWLYVQVANHWGQGVDKFSFEERKKFARDHLGDILDAASNALRGKRWWMEAEKPWQLLATCVEIRGALTCPTGHHTYMSCLPVHMDGSCNGLQHYAALGRDEAGGRAVNLLPEAGPQDVYRGVADIVARRVAADALAGHKEARLLVGQVDRKLVKQTVMTSVYGVTYVGAREQVASRLKDKGWQNPSEIYRVSRYAARLTLESIGELFNNAKQIMAWLAECAEIISSINKEVSWDSPMGVPVLQPYMQARKLNVATALQYCTVTLPDDSPDTKVARKRQRTAFPPNYIHCLDSAHMMMTALACREAGLAFAGVHDSYWTHAGTVREMNRLLRQMFVDLHSQPLLEDLLRQFKQQFPEVADELPPVPARGAMDLQQVLKSKYFFS